MGSFFLVMNLQTNHRMTLLCVKSFLSQLSRSARDCSLQNAPAVFQIKTSKSNSSRSYNESTRLRTNSALSQCGNEKSVGFFHKRFFHCAKAGRQCDTPNANSNSNRLTEVTDLTAEILKATQEVDVMAAAIFPTDVESLINNLHLRGLDLWACEKLLTGKLWLLQQPQATAEFLQNLLDHGLSPTLAADAIEHTPYAIQRSLTSASHKANDGLLLFRSLGFSEKELDSVLEKDSSVLFADEHTIQTAFARIKSYFPAADTIKVVCKSPNVLRDDWRSVQAKFEYCIFTMGYIQSDIVRSRLFSHTLRHIQDRHQFLYRANVFKTVNKKLHPSLNPNPRLKTVVDSSDAMFVKLVEGMNVADYAVFRKMRELERLSEELDKDQDLDSDGEEDDEQVYEKYEEERQIGRDTSEKGNNFGLKKGKKKIYKKASKKGK